MMQISGSKFQPFRTKLEPSFRSSPGVCRSVSRPAPLALALNFANWYKVGNCSVPLAVRDTSGGEDVCFGVPAVAHAQELENRCGGRRAIDRSSPALEIK